MSQNNANSEFNEESGSLSEQEGKKLLPKKQLIKLADQSIDSSEYIARYLSFTKSDTV